MPIIGVTHDKSGVPRVSRSVKTKVAIGLPPKTERDHPQRLDHFVFLKKDSDKGTEWVPDAELQKYFEEQAKGKPREFYVVFLDDDIDQVFRTEYAAYVKRGAWCRGDGENAKRRDLGQDGKQWGEMKVFNGPCAEGDCPVLENGDCAPSGDLYFMLADFPSLGSICRFHTSSYQSIRQIYSALQDLRRITGGRLMGVSAKLFMQPAKSVYQQGGQTRTGTKWVVGIELRAQDLQAMQNRMLETARVFSAIKGELAGQVLEIEETEEDRGAEITAEFIPPVEAAKEEAEELARVEETLRAQAKLLMQRYGLSEAQIDMKLSEHAGRMHTLIEKVKAALEIKEGAPKEQGNGHDNSAERTWDRGRDIAAGLEAGQPTPQEDPDGNGPTHEGTSAEAVKAEDALGVTADDIGFAVQGKERLF